MALYNEYYPIVLGNLHCKHIFMFLLLGFYINDVEYFYWIIVMALCSRAEVYVVNHLADKYPYLYRLFVYLINLIYLVCLTMCINFILDSIFLPLFKKFIIALK